LKHKVTLKMKLFRNVPQLQYAGKFQFLIIVIFILHFLIFHSSGSPLFAHSAPFKSLNNHIV